MKVSCTHFQCSAGAFSYLRDHFSHNFSVDMSHQILSLNINLMLVGSTRAGGQMFPWKREIKRFAPPPFTGTGSRVSPGEIHAGQQEELPGGSHQRSGPLVAMETVRP